MKLHKRGRMLVASYEAVRYQKLDLFSVTLRQIGAHISRMHLEDAIEVLMNGDGNDNAAHGGPSTAADRTPSPMTTWWTSGPSSTPMR